MSAINSAFSSDCESQFTTKSGRKCQNWSVSYPHMPNKLMGKFISHSTQTYSTAMTLDSIVFEEGL